MKLAIKKGRTSLLVRIFIQDSSSTTGAGLTGLTSGSTGLVCYRARDDDGNAGATQLTLSAGTRGTWSSGGFVEKDATNMPGVYELGLPDAGQATGSESVDYILKGATNMAPLALEIQLVAYDPQDATHLGLSALPNTAITTNGSLITSGGGTDQLSLASGRVDIGKALGTAVTLDANNVLNVSAKYVGGTLQTARDMGASVLLSPGTGAGQISLTSGAVTIGTNNDKNGYGLSGNVTVGGYAAGQDPATLVLAGTVESGLNLQQTLRTIAAAVAGVLAGAGTTTITVQAANNPATARISATVDASGNRSAVTLTP